MLGREDVVELFGTDLLLILRMYGLNIPSIQYIETTTLFQYTYNNIKVFKNIYLPLPLPLTFTLTFTLTLLTRFNS